jgi:hypothetical protein
MKFTYQFDIGLVHGNPNPAIASDLVYLVDEAPRKAARGREKDQLLLVLHMQSKNPIPENELAFLLELAHRQYFGTPRSATAAARAAIDAVNDHLRQRNQAKEHAGGLVQGQLTCLVLREDELYVTHAGLGSNWGKIAKQIENFSPNRQFRRALGSSAHPEVHYFHCKPQAQDGVLIVPANSQIDPQTLLHLPQNNPSAVLQQLARLRQGQDPLIWVQILPANSALELESAPQLTPTSPEKLAPLATPEIATPERDLAKSQDLQAVLERVRNAAITESQRISATTNQPLDAKTLPVLEDDELWDAPRETPFELQEKYGKQAVIDPSPLPDPSYSTVRYQERENPRRENPRRENPPPAQPLPVYPPNLAETPDARAVPPTTADFPADEAAFAQDFANAGDSTSASEASAQSLNRQSLKERRAAQYNRQWSVRLRNWFLHLPLLRWRNNIAHQLEKIGGVLRFGGKNWAERLSPNGDANYPPNQERILLAAAILVPLVVVFLAFSIYQRYGIDQQYNAQVAEALRSKETALSYFNDPVQQRAHWAAALEQIESAASLRELGETAQTLRQDARMALDQLDQIERLQTNAVAVGELPSNADFGKIFVHQNDLYVLDKTSNQIFRLLFTADGWKRDKLFSCGPGPVGDYTLATIVDFVYFPNTIENNRTLLLALDGRGNGIFCDPESETPTIARSLLQPNGGLSSDLDLAIFGETLYVLDRQMGELYTISREGVSFSADYGLYFTDNKPDLTHAQQMAIADGTLFLLLEDQVILRCSRALGSAKCDSISLLSPNSLTADKMELPLEMIYRQPPEPALLIGDTNSGAIHLYSLSLLHQKQYRAGWDETRKIGGFTFDENGIFYFTAGNHIFNGVRP